MRTADREAWLKLAADWRKLVESAELYPMLDTRHHWFWDHPGSDRRTGRLVRARPLVSLCHND